MARAPSRQNWSSDRRTTQDDRAPQAEWRDLRDDLVALLAQVDERDAGAPPASHGYSEQEPDTEMRRRADALRSVKQAVSRFSVREPVNAPYEQDLPAHNPRETLRDAISQIRARTEPLSSAGYAEQPRRISTNSERAVQREERSRSNAAYAQFNELAEAVSGISGRLERLETELRASRNSDADIADIAKQVSQLTNVVEMVAGAVGETSQIKRLEKQVAQIVTMLANPPKSDNGLAKRIDEVAATVDRLAEMQVQQLGRDSRAPEADHAARDDAMHAIEASVRNIYDRIDAFEKSFSLTPQDVERLTSEMAAFTSALHDGAGAAPGGLLARVDALNARLGQIEDASGNGAIGDIRADVSALRDAVADAVEPRFAAIESQIEALSGRVSSHQGQGGELDVSELEAQIRQLAQRMDQTGEQLTGLTQLYSNDERDSQPDYEALAALVAQRTSQEVAKSQGSSSLSDNNVAELEERLSRLFQNNNGAASAEAPAELASMKAGIHQVDQRLERLEAVLSAWGEKTAPSAAPEQPNFAAGPAASAHAAPKPKRARPDLSPPDNMPNNPGADAPLRDPGFPPASAPDWDVMETASAIRGPQDTVAQAQKMRNQGDDEAAFAPGFDPEKIERPGRPVSSFADEPQDLFKPAEPAATPAQPAPDMTWPEPVNLTPSNAGKVSTDRNTFIAAARRAAMRQSEDAPATQTSNSLIGRAFSRLQQKEHAPEPDPSAAIVLPGDAPAQGRHTYDLSDEDRDETASGGSFLTRHKRPLLLSAALVVVCLLALNLVTQRLNASSEGAAAPAPAAQSDMAPADPTASDGAPADSNIDNTPTGSINPMVQMDLMKPSPSGQPLPMVLQHAATKPEMSLSNFTTSSISPVTDITEQVISPIKLDLPPEEVGPLAMREAAANGDPRAQFEIAAIYTEGQTVERDFALAAKWYERAAAQGFAPAEYRLGTLYENGQGTDKDLQQARLWYQRAADAGNRMSMHNLAALYAGGELGKQEFSTAAQWFQAAAERGMKDSQFNLGMLYARGLGVPQSLEDSYKWFSLAASQGDKDAAKARDDVTRSLDADSISALQAKVMAWKPQPVDIKANFAPIGTWAEKFDPGKAVTDSTVIEKVQSALSNLGYDIGTPDGLMGPKTRDAIKAFESATGMNQTGLVNPRLLAVLGSQPV